MISVDRVYKTVLTLANTDIRGNITPAEFKLIVNNVINEIYEEYIFDINRFQNRENRGAINSGVENTTDSIREKLDYYAVRYQVSVNTVGNMPADIKYIDTLQYVDTPIESCKNMQEFTAIKNSKHTKPTAKNPIYIIQGDTFVIKPSTLSPVFLYYRRKPKIANWTYVVVNGAELFNPSAIDFGDIDMHNNEETNIILRTLKKFGVNLKEEDLQTLTRKEEIQNFQEETQA